MATRRRASGRWTTPTTPGSAHHLHAAEHSRVKAPKVATRGRRSISRPRPKKACVSHQRTGNDLGALEVLIGMEIAGRQGEPQANEDQQQVGPPPHVGGSGWSSYDSGAQLGHLELMKGKEKLGGLHHRRQRRREERGKPRRMVIRQ